MNPPQISDYFITWVVLSLAVVVITGAGCGIAVAESRPPKPYPYRLWCVLSVAFAVVLGLVFVVAYHLDWVDYHRSLQR